MAAALLLGGCTIYSGGLQTGGAEPRPKVILVSDFTISSDVVAIDRGYTARLERKVGTYSTYERRPRTTERVNNEIVATIVASLREAGLEAQPGCGGFRHAESKRPGRGAGLAVAAGAGRGRRAAEE